MPNKSLSFTHLHHKVFANAEPKTAREKFPESTALAQSCGRLLVTEVRRRASNQSTEEAAAAIAAFMEVNEAGDEFEGSNGWMLLTSLKILSSEGDDLVDVMTGASVPSTLVKCLYLFFDLPKLPDHSDEVASKVEWKTDNMGLTFLLSISHLERWSFHQVSC